MNINCISCGHRFDVGRAYDDYEGLVRCGTCRCLLDIKTVDGQIRGVRMGSLEQTSPQVPASINPQMTSDTNTPSSAQPLRVAA